MISGWKEEIQRNYLNFLRGGRNVAPAELAAQLSLSEGWVIYITGVELIKEDSASVEHQTPFIPQGRGRNPA